MSSQLTITVATHRSPSKSYAVTSIATCQGSPINVPSSYSLRHLFLRDLPSRWVCYCTNNCAYLSLGLIMAVPDFEFDPDIDDFQPPANKRAKNVKNRFRKRTSEEEIATLAKGFVPENTDQEE